VQSSTSSRGDLKHLFRHSLTKKKIKYAKDAFLKRGYSALPSRGHFLLGAAIGTGMAAGAAERGGADFLLALSAGRFRSMGAPSAACMLALRDSNRMVMEFGQAEILTQTSLPVFFGATAIGTTDLEKLVQQIADAGFHGVVNFPSCVFLDGQYRKFLEESGAGLDHEVALLDAARARGLSTLAYVHTVDEALRIAAHVDIVNLNFGWNMGGSVGVESSIDLHDSSVLAAKFVSAVQAAHPQTRCVIEGGPIVTPEQMDEVCRFAKADGYIGGSTIDRVPLESAIEMATSAFKTIGALRSQVDSLERRLNRKVTIDTLIGFSDSMERAREQVAQAMETDLPVLIVGEAGSGRRELAKAIHEARSPHGRWLISADCKAGAKGDMELNLFGCVAGAFPGIAKARVGLLEVARGSTLVLDDVGSLNIEVQRQLLQAVQTGGFWPRGGSEIISLEARFIGLSGIKPAAASGARRSATKFLQWLGAIRIEIPPLRERLEDLPMLAEGILRGIANGERRSISPMAIRALLGYDWPGNLGELRSVMQRAANRAQRGVITDTDVIALLKTRHATSSDRRSFASVREWVLDGLRRNRFRRAESAQFLQISRKTLYNKMRQYGLLNQRTVSQRARVRRKTRNGGSEPQR
jgi:predicted TIM-barrel enzyme/DNA-binding NtrC family response regulator